MARFTEAQILGRQMLVKSHKYIISISANQTNKMQVAQDFYILSNCLLITQKMLTFGEKYDTITIGVNMG